jgi:hypothetical protein
LIGARHGTIPNVRVDRRLASLWFGYSIKPQGWEMAPPWDPIAGDYRAKDGWIRLHTNAPHHRDAALKVLGVAADKDAVTKAVAGWEVDALETAIVAAGGCAATMRSAEAWAEHPQGKAVAAEHLVAQASGEGSDLIEWGVPRARPLAGVQVFDITRVLAGPVATRFLAGLGANVLRIDPPSWDEPGVIPEVMLGKRAARMNLHTVDDKIRGYALLRTTDVLVHGLRPGALDRLGFDLIRRRGLRPDMIDVALDAYGWSGPWAGRRGFDSLLQMSTGIAEAGMRQLGRDKPTPLPVQAIDHATGYFAAAAALRAMTHRLLKSAGGTARVSLARTAALIQTYPARGDAQPMAAASDDDYTADLEQTSWGPARRLKPPVEIAGASLVWDRPATKLGSAEAAWID